MSIAEADGSQLLEIVTALRSETGLGFDKLRVLSDCIDPLAISRKPQFHEAGRWFRDQMEAAGLLDRPKPIHLRGFHYVLISTPGHGRMIDAEDAWQEAAQCAFDERADRGGSVKFERMRRRL